MGSASASGIAALGAAGKEEEEEWDLMLEQRRGDRREGGWDRGRRQSKGAATSTGRESAKPGVGAALWQHCETRGRSGGGHTLAEARLRPNAIRFIHGQQPAGPTGPLRSRGCSQDPASLAARCGRQRRQQQHLPVASPRCSRLAPHLHAKQQLKTPLKATPARTAARCGAQNHAGPCFMLTSFSQARKNSFRLQNRAVTPAGSC